MRKGGGAVAFFFSESRLVKQQPAIAFVAKRKFKTGTRGHRPTAAHWHAARSRHLRGHYRRTASKETGEDTSLCGSAAERGRENSSLLGLPSLEGRARLGERPRSSA